MIDLFSEADLKKIAAYISNNTDRLDYNDDIFMIMEGNLKTFLEIRMKQDLGIKSYLSASTRQAPINILRKIVDKLTKIYSQTVIRTVENGTESDEKLLRWYEDILGINSKLSKNNENFNTYLYSILEIGLKNYDKANQQLSQVKKPFVRTIPNHQFLVMNTSHVDPTSPDVIIKAMEKRKLPTGTTESVYHIYTASQFVIMNQSGEILRDLMLERELDGENPYGVTPFVYANASQDCVMPEIQTDNKDMALLVPLLLTDLNYAVKFQAFSVFVAIDIEDKNIEFSPNSIISFQTKAGGEKPSFDVIKPTVDISETLSLASSQMALWLSTKGIRPGQIAQIGADQLASGISKMIDESDTFEAIKKQISIYEDFERDFWDRLLNDIHPAWVSSGVVENKTIFTPGARVLTKFTKPVPMQTRGELVKDLEAEMLAGFISKKRAIQRLNPEMTDGEIDDLTGEIEDDSPMIVPATQIAGDINGTESGNSTQT